MVTLDLIFYVLVAISSVILLSVDVNAEGFWYKLFFNIIFKLLPLTLIIFTINKLINYYGV